MEFNFSAQILSKAQAARSYIEHRHAILLQYHDQKQKLWEQLIGKMRGLRLPLQEQRRIRLRLSREEGGAMRQWRRPTALRDFAPVGCVGRGAFGQVLLCRGPRGEALALKQVSKAQVRQQVRFRQIRDERNLHALAEGCVWLAKTRYCFDDADCLFLAMDFLPGGDLLSLLVRQDTLPEAEARFYAAEVVLALAEVHALGYMHRDVKPDNLLIDADGHLKLADFGLCREKATGRERVLSAVGTKGYVAPEVCEQEEYTQVADWWSLGVIIFEMLVGYAPFTTSSAAETRQRTLDFKRTLVIPDHPALSLPAKDIIFRLLSEKNTRLGAKGVEQIQAHPFFAGVDWATLHQTTPPFRPQIHSRWDTRYFEPYLTLQPQAPTPQRGARQQQESPADRRAFVGYAYNHFHYSNKVLQRFLSELDRKDTTLKVSTTDVTDSPVLDMSGAHHIKTMSNQPIHSPSSPLSSLHIFRPTLCASRQNEHNHRSQRSANHHSHFPQTSDHQPPQLPKHDCNSPHCLDPHHCSDPKLPPPTPLLTAEQQYFVSPLNAAFYQTQINPPAPKDTLFSSFHHPQYPNVFFSSPHHPQYPNVFFSSPHHPQYPNVFFSSPHHPQYPNVFASDIHTDYTKQSLLFPHQANPKTQEHPFQRINRWKQSPKKHKRNLKLTPQKQSYQSSGIEILLKNFKSEEKGYCYSQRSE